MTRWAKQGRIFCPDGRFDWMRSHAQVPTVDLATPDRIRIYFGTRDQSNRSVTARVDVSAADPSRVLGLYDRPALDRGELGAFDDSGAMPSWVVTRGEEVFLYYTGWNTGLTVPYRNAIGLAVSHDAGITFQRVFRGPILDRSRHEPFFCATPCVMLDQGVWRMWYLSCTSWQMIDERPEPRYHIRYAESTDGADWRAAGITCIDFDSPDEGGIARPCVVKADRGYQMWYCYRKLSRYRQDRQRSYRIGYAESEDGLYWRRMDDAVGIDPSTDGWDSEMIAYPFVISIAEKKYLFYNGNGFGMSGVGYAVAESREIVANPADPKGVVA